MAINYYVSVQRGSDSNDGLSQETPYLTIAKAITMVTAGSIVYIGSGCYREKPVLATAGTLENPIKWIPDPNSEYLTSDNVGIVRVTCCDENEYPTTGGNGWSFNGKNYNEIGDPNKGFGQMHIDGCHWGYTVNVGFSTLGTKCYGITATGNATVFYYGEEKDCIAIAGQTAFSGGIQTNCISISGSSAYYAGIHYNCIGIAGYACFNAVTRTDINCLSIGGQYGFYAYSGVANSTNCVAIGSSNGFYATGSATVNYCRAINCSYGFYGRDSANLLNTSTCSYVYCNNKQRTSGWPTPTTYYETVEVALAKSCTYYPIALIAAFMPMLDFNHTGGSSDILTYVAKDMMGYARALIDGVPHYGVHENSIVGIDFDVYRTNAPSIRIEQAGQQKFTFFVTGGEEFSKSVWVVWDNVTGDKPQLIVRGEFLNEITDTASGDGVDWEQLTVTGSPTKDTEIELYLYARDSGVSATVYFSDLS